MKERIELNSNALWLRKEFGMDGSSPIDIFATLNTLDNLTVVFHPMSDRVSGMCVRTGKHDLIAINSALSYGRQRFSASHELYHLRFQKELRQVICGIDIGVGKDEEEKNADTFASYFLAPYDALRFFIRDLMAKKENNRIDLADILKIEHHFGMSRQATLYRLKIEGAITSEFAESLKSNVVRSAQKLGYDSSLYIKTPEDRQYFTTGSYINLVEKLLNQGIISQGKYEELLIDAYRSDIVYGLVPESEVVYD